MRNKFLESLYSDLSLNVKPLVKSYKDFLLEQEEVKKRLIDDLHNKFISQKEKVKSELENLHKDYKEDIREIMVDVEDFLESEDELYILVLEACLKFSYKCNSSEYDRFLSLQAKLDDILGSESYDILYQIKSCDIEYGTGRFIKSMKCPELNKDELGEALSKGTYELNIVFIFKALGF